MRVIVFRLAVLAIYAPRRIAHKSALTSLTVPALGSSVAKQHEARGKE